MALYDDIQGAVAPREQDTVIIKEEQDAQEGDRAQSSEPTPPPPTPPLPPVVAEPPTMVWELPPIAPLPDFTTCCPCATQSIGALEICGVFATGVVIGFIFCKVLTPTISESCDWGGSDC